MHGPALERRARPTRRQREAELRHDLTRYGHPAGRLTDQLLEELEELRERTLRDLMEGPNPWR